MDFFAQQDQARRNTRLLVLLFVAAVLLLVTLTNAAVAAFLFVSQDYNLYSGGTGIDGFAAYFSWARFGMIGFAVSATVAMVVFVKWIHLSTGGKAVAESMGGARVFPQSDDAAEQRCLNVVQEMALAANMPVPPLYVMNSERGINAFAAGITPANAVVAVTRGTIDHLKRDELQGVIAHEFSHILNGDMRLNIRLAAMLKGITFIGDVGHFFLRSSNHARTGSSSRRSGGPALLGLGLGLLLLGWLGGAVAGFIKAAISRQKEYLADASAVQFTRSKSGIADALKAIGGYIPGTLVHAARANEMSHIFFGQIEHRLWHLFATHPPLENRIRRVEPEWNGEFITREPVHYRERPTDTRSSEAGVGRAAIVTAAMAGALMDESDSTTLADAHFAKTPPEAAPALVEHISLPLARQCREPLSAHALIFSLLLDPVISVRQKQFEVIAAAGISGLRDATLAVWPRVQELDAGQRLPLVEMCLPALKSMSRQQYRVFKNTLLALIRADRQTELHEWCLFQLIRHYLDPEFFRVRSARPRHRKLAQVSKQLRIVLSVLAYHGHDDPALAFNAAVNSLDLNDMTIAPSQSCNVATFSRAVNELNDCYPLLKPRILKAMALSASTDGELNPRERELICSVAAVMDCPTPDL
ncbi:MAG: M48 family metalloprotease [Halieaceae bacterium]|nr:M48 family metalloprotease [Halieaceae bacterium]